MVIKKVIESEIVPYDTLQAEPFLTVHMLKRLCLQGDLTIVCSITKRRGTFKDHGKQFQTDSGANSLLCIRHHTFLMQVSAKETDRRYFKDNLSVVLYFTLKA